MKIEFGNVQKYHIDRGFGFVSRTFNNSDQLFNQDVWFHISIIKNNYPELANQLDSGSYANVCFWYEIDSGKREKVKNIWLDVNDIPEIVRDELIIYIEKMWHNRNTFLSSCLEKITLDLVGESRKNELKEIYDRKLIEATFQSKTIRKVRRRKRKNISQDDEISHVYIGLPEHLAMAVLWVAREYRTNPLSHIPGGSDVVVEYHDGRVFGYDWIKKPSAYISKFFAGIIEYASDIFNELDEQRQIEITKRKIAKVFARKYKDKNEYSTASFIEVWNSESSNEMPVDALKRFERQQQDQYDFEDEYELHRPLSKLEYYGSECYGYEDPTEEAMRLWGIPDPRLVEE